MSPWEQRDPRGSGAGRGRRRRSRRVDFVPLTSEDWVVESSDDAAILERVSPPSELGSELRRLAARPGWGERLGAAQVAAHWADIVGDELAGQCEPVRIAGGVLIVRAATPVWATQLRYLTAQLTARVDEVLGAGSVREVRIVVGPLGAPTDEGGGRSGGGSRHAPER